MIGWETNDRALGNWKSDNNKNKNNSKKNNFVAIGDPFPGPKITNWVFSTARAAGAGEYKMPLADDNDRRRNGRR